MRCHCGYESENKRAFLNHTRDGCKAKGTSNSTVICPCGTVVRNIIPSRQGRTKFCSKKCRDDNYVRPLGIKPNFVNGNKGWFTKGERSDSNHPNWVGDKVGYNALHTWVHRKLGPAHKCDECGRTEIPKGKQRFFQWANLSGEYKRDVSDWKQMCCVCHRKYDKITKLSREDANVIRDRYKKGESKESLAIEYSVNKGTISNIIRNKIQYYAT